MELARIKTVTVAAERKKMESAKWTPQGFDYQTRNKLLLSSSEFIKTHHAAFGAA